MRKQSPPAKARKQVPQREKLSVDLDIAELDWTEKQRQLIELILDEATQLVFIKGPAGSSKTTTAMFTALTLLQQHRISDIVLCRTVVESASASMGFLPGTEGEKFGPFMRPFQDKLELFLRPNQIKELEKENRLIATPINFMRGTEHNNRLILLDEAQNVTIDEINTLITRTGKNSKTLVCADPDQTDLSPGKEGFSDCWNEFQNEQYQKDGIFCFEFGEEDILRSRLVRVIVKAMKVIKAEKKRRREQYLGSRPAPRPEIALGEEWSPLIHSPTK